MMQRSLGGLRTVCAEANCPNIGECWARGTATFMIMGDVCTRGLPLLRRQTGRPGALDPQEPARLAESIARLGMKYAVITCVDRDDLPDSGAAHWAACIRAVREHCRRGHRSAGRRLPGAAADIATVVLRAARMCSRTTWRPCRACSVRCAASRLLGAQHARAGDCAGGGAGAGIPLLIKSGMMLGLGETNEEVARGAAHCCAQ